jgi:predicted dehydrogenase
MNLGDFAGRSGVSRRQFLRTAAATGAGAVLSRVAAAQVSQPASQPTSQPTTKPFNFNLGIVGTGKQGRVLLNAMFKIPGLQFKAVCDIWPYSQKYGSGIIKRLTNQTPNVYTDYQEMLEKEKALDAVIVATPDFWHAPITIAALEAGKHVYCEKEMANTLESAKKMVDAAKKSGKLLQIGHQRRSNPRYFHALKMIDNDKMCGRLTTCYGQWNRPAQELELPPKEQHLDESVLKKYGYDTMERFCNWRWYKKFGGGPIADLGSHQIDVFSWFLHCQPKAIIASGGRDYYTDREWYDSVMAIYEYAAPGGTVRAFYQVLNTTSNGGYYEVFMGVEGSMQVSENPQAPGYVTKEASAKRRPWEDEAALMEKAGAQAIELKVGYSITDPAKKQELLASTQKPVHQLHLENFLGAIRDGTPLSCPGEVGYETAVAVLKVNEAVEAGKRLEFKPEEFRA